MLEGQWPFQLQNGIDKRKQVMQTLKFLHGDLADVFCLDITTIPEDSLKPTHGFIGTPPCEDFSMLYSGTDGGINGSRGDLFMVQLRMIERMAHKNTGSTKLQWVLLETCRCVLANTRKGCAWAVVEAWWLANMYDFTPLQVWDMQLMECSSPNSRGRVILVSFARSFLEAVDDCVHPKLEPHPPVPLEDFLHDNDKPLKPSDITVKQFENLNKWNQNFQKAVKDKFGGAADKGTILGVTDLRRDPGMKFNAKVSINEVPIFTTSNNH